MVVQDRNRDIRNWIFDCSESGSIIVENWKKQKTILEKQQAIEKERTRIATDMHDDLGAGLSRIKFLSETIGIKKQKQEPIEDEISKIREVFS